jgi:hypothetical protein
MKVFISNSTTTNLQPVRLAYQPPASSTFLSEQTSHQQPANSTFLSEQISTSHQPPAKRTGCCLVLTCANASTTMLKSLALYTSRVSQVSF